MALWKKTVDKILSIPGLAIAGSIAGSAMIGIAGIIAALLAYPNTSEYLTAGVGAVFGSVLSIPLGWIVGLLAGNMIDELALRRTGQRPAALGRASAFVISTLLSAVSLVPIGFFFFALGHI